MNQIPTKMLAFGAVGLIALGLLLIVLSVAGWPNLPASAAVVDATPSPHIAQNPAATAFTAPPAAAPDADVGASAEESAAAPPSTPPVQVVVALGAGVPDGLRQALAEVELDGAAVVTTTAIPAAVRFDATPEDSGQPAYTVTFAAATRFDTIDTALAWNALHSLWSGQPLTATRVTTAPVEAAAPFTRVVVLSDTLPLLNQVLGAPSPAVVGVADMPAVVDAAWQERTTLAIVPFDQLEPRLVVLAIDGQNPVENHAHFDPTLYPLTATLYAHHTARDAAEREKVDALLQTLPAGNRDPEQLTVLTMTGVTAMCRMTAAQMDRLGAAWPAEEVGAELASADITHISNEVPFVEDCVANTDPENFNFCSKPEYMKTLTASGVDIIGMTGNHQNDFGRENALASLAMYDAWGLPYYGGGKTLDDAFKPFITEHNGNRLAFLGANSYGPQMAWATDALPGAAPFDLNILSATIRSIKEKDLADIVLVELQYQESYDALPLDDQRLDFNALVRAGADIVTGVQSHVPQGMEFTDGKLVLYGLGNLYFDQMWAQATREGMVVKHTFYNGRHISTQILTTLLYDYGQPRWTSTQERASILNRIFDASYW
jgi:hypothetical protein